MAGFNFSKFNKERLFDIDTSDFEYTNLEELYNANGANFVYELRGVYIGTKSIYDPEAPMVATDREYVNIPVHQLPEIKQMLADKLAIREINEGNAGFIIESFYQKRFQKTCYVARWGNLSELKAEAAEKEGLTD